MEILKEIPPLTLGQHVCIAGNTGEGKSYDAALLLLSVPDAIIVNTKNDPFWGRVGVTIDNDNDIYDVGIGRWDFRPSDKWKQSMDEKNRFFKWLLDAGHRACYLDEVAIDICPSAQVYPYEFRKCFTQGRWKRLSMMISSQQLIYIPRWCFALVQIKYVHYLGSDEDRERASKMLQQDIDWSLLPERSHKFLLQTPNGTFGPQPRLDIETL